MVNDPKVKKNKQENIAKYELKRIKKFKKLGYYLALIALTLGWIQCFSYILSGNQLGHKNYFGQNVGTVQYFILLFASSCAFIYVSVRKIKNGKK